MRLMTLLIVGLVFAFAASVTTPPDVLSQITAMVAMFIVYGLVFFAVSRVKSFKQTPESMRKVIIALVCLLSIATVSSVSLWQRCYELSIRQHGHTTSEEPNDVNDR
jgi:uncharacterized membrane protein SirB2